MSKAELRWVPFKADWNKEPGAIRLGSVVHAVSGNLMHESAVSLREAAEIFLDTPIIVRVESR